MTLQALTLHRPWDQSILVGPKKWENRTWERRSIIGRFIVLHAGQKWDGKSVEFMAKLGFVPPLGENDAPAQALVGVARIASMITVKGEIADLFVMQSLSPWAFGPKAWELADIQALKMPILCKGHQGLWNLTSEQEGRVRAQVVMPP